MPASAQRIGEIESRLECLEARVDALGIELRASDEETRRQMRVLHEDVIDRIRTLGEQLAATRPTATDSPRPPRRPQG